VEEARVGIRGPLVRAALVVVAETLLPALLLAVAAQAQGVAVLGFTGLVQAAAVALPELAVGQALAAPTVQPAAVASTAVAALAVFTVEQAPPPVPVAQSALSGLALVAAHLHSHQLT
jgi:hypothetical protein